MGLLCHMLAAARRAARGLGTRPPGERRGTHCSRGPRPPTAPLRQAPAWACWLRAVVAAGMFGIRPGRAEWDWVHTVEDVMRAVGRHLAQRSGGLAG